MPRENVSLNKFNRGLISPLALARVDIKRGAFAAETMNNWTPRVFGSMMLRPGYKYLASTDSDNAAFNIPFIFSTDDTALIELTDATARIWISDALITRPSVSSSVTNGTFDSALTSWIDADESGGTSAWKVGGYMSLIGDGTNVAKRYQKITVSTGDAGTEHALRITVERGPVTFRAGSGIGSDNLISETVLDKGEHSLSFTPNADFYIEFESRLKYDILVDSVAVESSGTVSITAPWAAADLTKIRFDQSADIVYVACNGYQQYKIERRATKSWSVVRYYADDGPFKTINITKTTITPSALSGNVTLTASTPIFKSGHKEALFRLTSTGQIVTTDVTAQDTFTNTIEVTGTNESLVQVASVAQSGEIASTTAVSASRVFQITRAGTWVATVTLQRSLTSDTGPWEDVTTYTTNATISYDDAFENVTAWYRIGVKTGDFTSGTVELTLDYPIGSIEGIARVTSDENSWVVKSASEANNWREITWSPDLAIFCAVSSGGTNQVMTSSDGSTWTARAESAAESWEALTWSPDLTLFAAVSDGANGVMTSPDGTTWTSRSASSTHTWHGIAWSPSLTLFVAVAENGSIMSSPDGTNWTDRSASDAAIDMKSICWSPELAIFCVVGNGGTTNVETSSNGTSWTGRTEAESNTWRSVCWSPELSLFCAVSEDGTNRVMTSPDGTTWTSRSAAAANQWQDVEWSADLNKFVAVAISGTNTRVMYSSDGTTWTSATEAEGNNWASLAWSPELRLFAAVATGGTNRVMISTTDGKNVNAEVLTDFGKTDATTDWYEGSWSDYRGWPTSLKLAEGRLFQAGQNNNYGSVSDGYHSYDDNVVGDSGTIGRTIGSGPVDTIEWLLSLKRLLMGAEGTEFVCKSSAFDEPLTPTAFSIRRISSQGSAAVEAHAIDDVGVFVQRGGTRLFQLAQDGGSEYKSNDLTLLVPEVLLPQVKRIAIQRQPDTRIICVLNDGTLAFAVFDRAEDVLAWYTHSTDGTYEDVVVLPGADGTGEDAVYFVINRTGGRYLERTSLESECQGGTLNKQLDSFLLYSGAATATVTGLGHLEGESVEVWADGKYNGTYTVTSGQITSVSPTVSEAVIGLTYTAQWKSTKLAYASHWTALNQKKKIEHLGLIMKNTYLDGLQYGPSFTTLYDLPSIKDGTTIAADTVHATYDEEAFEFGGEWDSNSRLCLQAVAPKPVTCLAATISVEGHDKY